MVNVHSIFDSFWLGVMSIQSPALRSHDLTVAMQLGDPQLLVSVPYGEIVFLHFVSFFSQTG